MHSKVIRKQCKNPEMLLAEITGIQKERARIAYDLHDELGPILSYIKIKINLLEIYKTEDKIQLEKINETIDNGLTRIREISYDLMPSDLTKGLRSAIRDHVNSIDMKVPDIGLTFPESILFNKQQSVHIYQIVQEVIHNTIKHADAKQLDINFKKRKNTIVISLKDNGKGFELKEISSKEGLGLKSLRRRTQLLNGKMSIQSKTGAGTKFTFEIPVEK